MAPWGLLINAKVSGAITGVVKGAHVPLIEGLRALDLEGCRNGGEIEVHMIALNRRIDAIGVS